MKMLEPASARNEIVSKAKAAHVFRTGLLADCLKEPLIHSPEYIAVSSKAVSLLSLYADFNALAV